MTNALSSLGPLHSDWFTSVAVTSSNVFRLIQILWDCISCTEERRGSRKMFRTRGSAAASPFFSCPPLQRASALLAWSRLLRRHFACGDHPLVRAARHSRHLSPVCTAQKKTTNTHTTSQMVQMAKAQKNNIPTPPTHPPSSISWPPSCLLAAVLPLSWHAKSLRRGLPTDLLISAWQPAL